MAPEFVKISVCAHQGRGYGSRLYDFAVSSHKFEEQKNITTPRLERTLRVIQNPQRKYCRRGAGESRRMGS